MKSKDIHWVEIGDYIKQSDERNSSGQYTLQNLRGISIQKKFIDTKANMDGVSLTPYKVVKPNYFCFVTITSRNSEKITLAMNDSAETYIVSSSYEVFYITDDKYLLPEYLLVWFKRPEFDRYTRYHSWGSARETFSFEDMRRVKIPLLPIEQQRVISELYKAVGESKMIAELLENQFNGIWTSLLMKCLKEE